MNNSNNNSIDNMKKNIYKLQEEKKILKLKLNLIEEDLKLLTKELYLISMHQYNKIYINFFENYIYMYKTVGLKRIYLQVYQEKGVI